MGLRLLFLALLLFTMPFAANYPAGVKLYGYYMVPEGLGFSIENFTYGQGQAYAIVSAGEVYAILVPKFPLFMPEPLTQREEIESALYSYYISKGRSPRAIEGFSQIHAKIRGISASYDAGEDKCRILLGTDRHPCFDFDSCQKACYSVTSFCLPLALGSGRNFIGYISEFENASSALNLSYAVEQEAYSNLTANSSRQNVLAYISAIEGIKNASYRAYASPFYWQYQICALPDYSIAAIEQLHFAARNQYNNASPFYILPSLADAVKKRTEAGIQRKRQAELSRQQPGASKSSNQSHAKQDASERQKKLEEEKEAYLSQALLPLAAVTLSVLFAGLALIFYAFFLRRKKSP
ncbi:MAG: hypothetical protein N3E51_01595 [Candidatus Micrarchaeota archaeon]|nr:hypothetical protein [Candidatus Micrarchaeota archaeon]